jgi:hypothetical protein
MGNVMSARVPFLELGDLKFIPFIYSWLFGRGENFHLQQRSSVN